MALYPRGLVPYEQGERIQRRLFEERHADRISDALVILQHPPVVTLGRRGRESGLVTPRAALQRLGVGMATASRGGDITYHAPGQWVVYPVIRLGSHEADARGYLANLEEVAIRTAADFGVAACRRPGLNGAWTPEGKLAAIGFHLKRWITQHGMSFNATVDLSGFGHIIPCGLRGEPVASLRSILGDRCPALERVRDSLARHFESVFGRRLCRVSGPGELPAVLEDLGPVLFPPD